MPKYTNLSFRAKRGDETDLSWVEYKIRKVKQTIARQQWLMTHRKQIEELVKKEKELENEIMDYYLISLANGLIDERSFETLQYKVDPPLKQEMDSPNHC